MLLPELMLEGHTLYSMLAWS
jgi:hypothetical protein